MVSKIALVWFKLEIGAIESYRIIFSLVLHTLSIRFQSIIFTVCLLIDWLIDSFKTLRKLNLTGNNSGSINNSLY